MMSHPLLRLVPPLNNRYSDTLVWNRAYNTVVTHQSFSAAASYSFPNLLYYCIFH